MPNKQLVEYIDKRLGENVEKQNIINELLNAGWPASDISKAFSVTGGGQTMKSDLPKKKLLVISVATILFLVGMSFLTYQYLLKPRFEILELSISTNEAALYEEILVKAVIKNSGFSGGQYNLELILDGRNVENMTIDLDGRDTKEVQIELMFTEDDEWGVHSIELGNKNKSLVVNEGLLPIVAIGDTIILKGTIAGGFALETTEIVVGEDTISGIECWVVKVTTNPEIVKGFDGGFCTDKETLFPLIEIKTDLVDSLSVTKILDPSPIFPLEVGQIINVEQTTDTTINFPGKQVEQKNTRIFQYRIMGIEDVDTQIGKIKAFRIDVYEDGKLTDTIWQAPKAKLNIIKAINYKSGDTQILKSFTF